MFINKEYVIFWLHFHKEQLQLWVEVCVCVSVTTRWLCDWQVFALALANAAALCRSCVCMRSASLCASAPGHKWGE